MTPQSPETRSTSELAGWSEEDKLWLEALPPVLQINARRYGRALFTLVMSAGVSGAALGKVLSRNRGNREMHVAVQILQGQLSGLLERVLKAEGHTREQFENCRTDVERVGAIAMAAAQPGEKRSGGGIILES